MQAMMAWEKGAVLNESDIYGEVGAATTLAPCHRLPLGAASRRNPVQRVLPDGHADLLFHGSGEVEIGGGRHSRPPDARRRHGAPGSAAAPSSCGCGAARAGRRAAQPDRSRRRRHGSTVGSSSRRPRGLNRSVRGINRTAAELTWPCRCSARTGSGCRRFPQCQLLSSASHAPRSRRTCTKGIPAGDTPPAFCHRR